MKRITLGLIFALVTLDGAASITAASAAAHVTPLAVVAARLGFSYAYLGPEDAVALSRTGVTVLIRPGERLFDVNDQTEAMDGAAPYFSRHDLLISDTLVKRLRQIAAHFPMQVSDQDQVRSVAAAPGTRPGGAIGSLAVVQIPGTLELSVAGKAPANLPVTLTLLGSLSKDIPDVVLSRHQVYPEADGSFQASISAAPGYFSGTTLTVVASALPGVSSASARVILRQPTQSVNLSADESQ